MWLHARLTTVERDAAVKAFQDDPGVLCLVATGLVAGTGITLNKAMRLIMVESQSDSGLWSQMMARMHRYGNWNWEGVYAYEICNDASLPEVEARQRRLGNNKLADQTAQRMMKLVLNPEELDLEELDPEELDPDDQAATVDLVPENNEKGKA